MVRVADAKFQVAFYNPSVLNDIAWEGNKVRLPCLHCEHEELRQIRRYRTNTQYGKRVFGSAWVHECDHCGLVQTIPRPPHQALANYYAVDYRYGGKYGSDVADGRQFPKDNLFYFNRGQSIAELVLPHLQKDNPRILDVGAGYGHILYALSQRYPRSERVAIEFANVCVQHLEAVGIRVFNRPAEEVLGQMEQQFDLVVLSHVLEHVLDPCTMLRLIHASLVPGGMLYVEVPNIPRESLLRYPDQTWAPRWDEPHITFFSVPTLRDLLESVGFELCVCDTAGPTYKYISPLRYRLPPLRSFLQGLLPSPLFLFLRRQGFTKPLRVQEREESFWQYGGFRIWIRSVAKKRERHQVRPRDSGTQDAG